MGNRHGRAGTVMGADSGPALARNADGRRCRGPARQAAWPNRPPFGRRPYRRGTPQRPRRAPCINSSVRDSCTRKRKSRRCRTSASNPGEPIVPPLFSEAHWPRPSRLFHSAWAPKPPRRTDRNKRATFCTERRPSTGNAPGPPSPLCSYSPSQSIAPLWTQRNPQRRRPIAEPIAPLRRHFRSPNRDSGQEWERTGSVPARRPARG